MKKVLSREKVLQIIIRRMNDYANMPLNKRPNAFDELYELELEIEKL